jgi:hypothetical protein
MVLACPEDHWFPPHRNDFEVLRGFVYKRPSAPCPLLGVMKRSRDLVRNHAIDPKRHFMTINCRIAKGLASGLD